MIGIFAEQSASTSEVSASTETLRAQVEHVQLQSQVLVARFTTETAPASEHRTAPLLRRVA